MRHGLILVIVALFFTACGENLSFKEGASKDTMTRFMENLKQDKKEEARKFVLKNLPEASLKSVEAFLSIKIEDFEILEELYSMIESVPFKNKAEAAGKPIDISAEAKEKEFVTKMETILTSLQPELKPLVKEKAFFVKVKSGGKDAFYLIFYYSSQNLTNVTGVAELKPEIANNGQNFSDNLYTQILKKF